MLAPFQVGMVLYPEWSVATQHCTGDTVSFSGYIHYLIRNQCKSSCQPDEIEFMMSLKNASHSNLCSCKDPFISSHVSNADKCHFGYLDPSCRIARLPQYAQGHAGQNWSRARLQSGSRVITNFLQPVCACQGLLRQVQIPGQPLRCQSLLQPFS